METLKSLWALAVKHGSAVCDFGAITIGALAGFTTLFPPKVLTGLLVTGAVLAAWRRFFISLKAPS